MRLLATIADEAGNRLDSLHVSESVRACWLGLKRECQEAKRARGGDWRVVRVEELQTKPGDV